MKIIHSILFNLGAVMGFFLYCSYNFAQSVHKEYELNLSLDDYRGELQWEVSLDKQQWSPIAGGEFSNFQTKANTTSYYRAAVTEPGCSTFYSDLNAIFVTSDSAMAGTLIKGKLKIPSELG